MAYNIPWKHIFNLTKSESKCLFIQLVAAIQLTAFSRSACFMLLSWTRNTAAETSEATPLVVFYPLEWHLKKIAVTIPNTPFRPSTDSIVLSLKLKQSLNLNKSLDINKFSSGRNELEMAARFGGARTNQTQDGQNYVSTIVSNRKLWP
jgi:hypothetical protein